MRTITQQVGFATVLVLLAIVTSAASGAGLPSGAERTGRPLVTITSTAPLVVVGHRFKAGERVSVAASIAAAEARKVVVADRSGRFTARFRAVRVCGPIVVDAIGRGGSRASVKKHVIPAPCGVDPAPAPGLDR